MSKNIYLIAKQKANMMENNLLGLGYLPNWNQNFKKLYISIERFFAYLKNHLNMTVNQTHSALLASQMFNLELLQYETI